jgi:hypothetical protein
MVVPLSLLTRAALWWAVGEVLLKGERARRRARQWAVAAALLIVLLVAAGVGLGVLVAWVGLRLLQ